jgi:hypothetical protein
MKTRELVALFAAGAAAGGIVAWLSNLFWLFQNLGEGLTVQSALSLMGVLLWPLGILHGVYTWVS